MPSRRILIAANDQTERRIRVRIVMALNEVKDIERAVGVHIDDFVSKPVNKIELVKRFENMLRRG